MEKVKHKPVKQSNYFKVEGKKIERTRKVCPRCGDGTFLGKHKNRHYCGRCKYTEFLNEKPSEKSTEEKNTDKKNSDKPAKPAETSDKE